MRTIIPLCVLLLACGSQNGDPADTATEPDPTDTISETTDPAHESTDVPAETGDPPEDPTAEDSPGDPGEEEVAPECTRDEDCDNGDPCTTDTCSGAGACEHAYSSAFLTIGATTRVTNTSENSLFAGLEWTGSEFGVTWNEMHYGTPGPVYFKRLSSDGAVIGSDVRVSDPSTDASAGSLVWSGSEYGISWIQSNRVYFGRMSGAGTAVGLPIDVSSGTGWTYEPAIAWSGSEYALAWRQGGEIQLARVEARGYVIGTPTNISETTPDSHQPRIEWSGSEYGLAWTDSRGSFQDTYFARVSPTGTRVATPILVTTTRYSSFVPPAPGLAWSGSEYGLGWFGQPSTLNSVLFGRVSAAGAEVGSDTTLTSTSADLTYLDAEWADGTYGLAWTDSRHGNNEILFGVVSPTGTLVESDHNLTSNSSISEYPILAWTGSQYGLAWDDTIDSSTNKEVYFTLLTVCPGP